MTGPEHYLKAERLLKDTATSGSIVTERDEWQQRQALVHATLALAAATAVKSPADDRARAEAAGTRLSGSA